MYNAMESRLMLSVALHSKIKTPSLSSLSFSGSMRKTAGSSLSETVSVIPRSEFPVEFVVLTLMLKLPRDVALTLKIKVFELSVPVKEPIT